MTEVNRAAWLNPVLFSINSWTVLLASIHVPGAALIAAGLGVSIETTQLAVAVYLAVYASSQILVVIFTGIRQPVNIILAGCVIAGLGTAVCAVSQGIEMFFFGRAVQAVGASLCVLSIRVFARRFMATPRAATFLPSLFVVTSTALLLGPLAAGYLMGTAGWATIFFACLAWGSATLLLCFFSLWRHAEWRRDPPPAQSGGANVRNFVDCLKNPRVLLFIGFNTAIYWGFYGFVAGAPVAAAALGITDAKSVGQIAASAGFGAICGGLLATYLARIWTANRIIGVGLSYSVMPALLMFAFWGDGIVPAIVSLGFVGFCIGSAIGLVQPNALLSVMNVPGTNPAAAAAITGCMQILGGSLAAFVTPFAGGSFENFVVVLGAAGWLALLAWLTAQRRRVS